MPVTRSWQRELDDQARRDDPVADAARIMRQQVEEIHHLRIELIKARSLLRQANVYVRITKERWVAIGCPPTPASDVQADIEKFLDETEVKS